MSDYLSSLLKKARGLQREVRPRLPGLFEPFGKGERTIDTYSVAIPEREDPALDRMASPTADPIVGLEADAQNSVVDPVPSVAERREGPNQRRSPSDFHVPKKRGLGTQEADRKGGDQKEANAEEKLSPPNISLFKRKDLVFNQHSVHQDGGTAPQTTSGKDVSRRDVPQRDEQLPVNTWKDGQGDPLRKRGTPPGEGRHQAPEQIPEEVAARLRERTHGLDQSIRRDRSKKVRADPPSVEVTIGRVEVRAVGLETPSHPQPVSRKPNLTLGEYLKQRESGQL